MPCVNLIFQIYCFYFFKNYCYKLLKNLSSTNCQNIVSLLFILHAVRCCRCRLTIGQTFPDLNYQQWRHNMTSCKTCQGRIVRRMHDTLSNDDKKFNLFVDRKLIHLYIKIQSYIIKCLLYINEQIVYKKKFRWNLKRKT